MAKPLPLRRQIEFENPTAFATDLKRGLYRGSMTAKILTCHPTTNGWPDYCLPADVWYRVALDNGRMVYGQALARPGAYFDWPFAEPVVVTVHFQATQVEGGRGLKLKRIELGETTIGIITPATTPPSEL
jgi:hypothetical protein